MLILKEIKKRTLELIDHKKSRVENYESTSTISGAALLIALMSNNSLIYVSLSVDAPSV